MNTDYFQSAGERRHDDSYGLDMHRVVIEGPGVIADLKLNKTSLEISSDEECIVAIKAFSLNFGDLLCLQGLYPTMPEYPFTPGFEASGTILRAAKGSKHFAVGDRVMVAMGQELGGQSSAVICHESQLTKMPSSMSFADASALPGVAITILDAFSHSNPLAGERMLIQTATGGAGLLAVQLAQGLGVEVIATAGSNEKLDYLEGMGVKHLINYREQDFEAEVGRITKGEGVDVVINTLSGDALVKGMNVLRSGGRYVELAMTALRSARSVPLEAFQNNKRFFSIDLRKLTSANPRKVMELKAKMLALYKKGVIAATICEEFSLDDIHKAYSALQNRRNIGKIVVNVGHKYGFNPPAL